MIPAAPIISSPARTLLAFDYGEKRIGVAVGQELTRSANPLTTLTRHGGKTPWDAVTDLVAQWRPQAFVVGLPLNRDGSEHAVSRAARRFGNQLQGRYNLPVFWVDERLTSFEAEHILSTPLQGGRRKKPQKADIDKLAAQLILQAWFEQH